MDISKSKLQITKKSKPVKLGASTSSDKKSPLAGSGGAKKDYSKNKKVEDFGTTGFGQTGLTGES